MAEFSLFDTSGVWLFVGICLIMSGSSVPVNPDVVLRVAAGEDVVLPCYSSSEETVLWQRVTTWSDDASKISTHGMITRRFRSRFSLIRLGADLHNLFIKPTVIEDEGNYSCVEENGIGTKHSVRLEIYDRGDNTLGKTVSSVMTPTTTISFSVSNNSRGGANASDATTPPTTVVLVALLVILSVLMLTLVIRYIVIWCCRKSGDRNWVCSSSSASQNEVKAPLNASERY